MKKWTVILGISMLTFAMSACVDTGKTGDTEDKQDRQSDPAIVDEEIDSSETNESSENKIDETIKEEIHDDASVVALVNKEYSLGKDYIPEDLVTIDVPTVLENPEVNQLRKEAAEALKQMFDEAIKSDIYLHARSGYRSYSTQVQLFDNYAAEHGEEAANRYSARPGESEHQTGLVMDVTSESMNYQLGEEFGDTKEGIWLSEHAHEFGFIIRYPEGAENVTGYIYEPWHIRYLGIEMATNVYESGLTYEEYLEEEGWILEVDS